MLESVVAIDLPVEIIHLIQNVTVFQAASRSEKQRTEWFLICSSSNSLVNWNNREFIDNRLNNIEFAALAARAYTALFELSKQGIPYCVPSSVIAVSSLATKLMSSLPHNSLLPGLAKDPDFLKGLADLSQLKPSDVHGHASGRGKPVIRWLIRKLAEEFCYSFAREPTVSIIGDLVRLGWPTVADRSIRNTFTSELSLQALETARIRRDNDNKSKTIAHQVISGLPSTSKGIAVNQSSVEPIAFKSMSDELILELIEEQAKTLNNESIKLRLISFIKAMQYEEQEYLDDGN
ncbi:hypothetical protein [Methylobacter tundripaludum]